MRNILLLFSIFFQTTLMGVETIIQGSIEDFNQKKLKVAVVEDFITSKKVFLAETTIENNQFRISIHLKNVAQLFLKVEDKESSFFAESGKVYNLQLNYDPSKNEGQAYNKVLDLKMSFPKAGELNQVIKDFNTEMRNFFTEHHEKFIVKNAHNETEKFIQRIEADEKYKQHPFVNQYVRYALANLKHINRAPREELFNTYLKNQKVLLQHKEYMNFFIQFYQKDFEQFCITKEGALLLRAIMFEKDLEKSLTIIKENKKFLQTELSELYFINGLFEVFHKKTIDTESNFAMLNQIAEKGSNEGIRSLAKSVSEDLKSYSKQKVAPLFSLYNQENELISLNDFKGKPIYLNFWADWSIPSLKQLSIINKLHQDYGDKIHFISINLDESTAPMNRLIEQNNFKWTFLHYNNDYEIREKYEVRAVPSYYLIDKKGNFINAYAPGPAEIDKTLYNLSRE